MRIIIKSMKIIVKRLISIFFVTIFILCLFFSLGSLIQKVEKRFIYPLKYHDVIKEVCAEYQLDVYLVYALIKTESSFKQNVVSKKGAKGLMQITDSTAQFIAERLDIKDCDIFAVKTNVKFGCYYLNYLLKRFSAVETALCAYNAGEGNVSNWLEDEKCSIDGVNLIYIPFGETREYIKKISRRYRKYKNLYENFVDKR